MSVDSASNASADGFTLLRATIGLPSLHPKIVFFAEFPTDKAVAWCNQPEMTFCDACRPGKPCTTCDDDGIVVSPMLAYWRQQRHALGWHTLDGHC